jgi:hypothetical protein
MKKKLEYLIQNAASLQHFKEPAAIGATKQSKPCNQWYRHAHARAGGKAQQPLADDT